MRAGADRAGAGAHPQPVPDRRHLRQPAVRLRLAAAPGHGAGRRGRQGRASSTCGRRAAASACWPSCRRTSCSRRRGWTPSRPTSGSASAPTCGTTASAPRSCSTWASAQIRLLTNNPREGRRPGRLRPAHRRARADPGAAEREQPALPEDEEGQAGPPARHRGRRVNSAGQNSPNSSCAASDIRLLGPRRLPHQIDLRRRHARHRRHLRCTSPGSDPATGQFGDVSVILIATSPAGAHLQLVDQPQVVDVDRQSPGRRCVFRAATTRSSSVASAGTVGRGGRRSASRPSRAG